MLFHASDEWFSGGYGLYRHFDAVIRNFATSLAKCDGISTIPEGYSNGFGNYSVDLNVRNLVGGNESVHYLLEPKDPGRHVFVRKTANPS
jgi:hypothetical protein